MFCNCSPRYSHFPAQIMCLLKYLAILSQVIQYLINYFNVSYCASSNIFLSLFMLLLPPLSSGRGSDILWHLTIQSWRWWAGQAGIAGNVSETSTDVELPGYPGNSSKQLLPRLLLLPENVAQKKLPLIERSMAFQRVNMGRIYGRRHLQMFSHPSGVSFSSPLLLSFLSVGFVWREHLLTHILLIPSDCLYINPHAIHVSIIISNPSLLNAKYLRFEQSFCVTELVQCCFSPPRKPQMWFEKWLPFVDIRVWQQELLLIETSIGCQWWWGRIRGLFYHSAPAVPSTNISNNPRNLPVHTID